MTLTQFIANAASDCIDSGDQTARVVRALRASTNGRITIRIEGVSVALDDDGERLSALASALDDDATDFLGGVAEALGYARDVTGAEVTDDGREDMWWS